jgi:hypothetical protein
MRDWSTIPEFPAHTEMARVSRFRLFIGAVSFTEQHRLSDFDVRSIAREAPAATAASFKTG